MENKHRNFLAAAALLAGLAPAPARAALLLYEGFNGYTAAATLNTLTPNGNTSGLATTGTGSSYANASANNSPTGMSILADGLTFGSLTTSGGRVLSNSGTNVASANINSTTASSVVWGSYLVRFGSISGTGSNGIEIRLNSNASSNASLSYFRSDADARFTNETAPGVSYGLDLGIGATVLDLSTIYYIVSKFDSSGTGGSASLWALNSAQFEAFVTAGRTEAHLNGMGNVTSTASTTTMTADKGWNSVSTPAYLEFVTQGIAVTFDEVRYGETLLDVSPVPEPATAALMLGGLGLLLRRRRA